MLLDWVIPLNKMQWTVKLQPDCWLATLDFVGGTWWSVPLLPLADQFRWIVEVATRLWATYTDAGQKSDEPDVQSLLSFLHH
jgi:hypothetical protein